MAFVKIISSCGLSRTLDQEQKLKIITLSKVAEALSTVGLVVHELDVHIGDHGELNVKIEAIVNNE
jgi:hypothetical protein